MSTHHCAVPLVCGGSTWARRRRRCLARATAAYSVSAGQPDDLYQLLGVTEAADGAPRGVPQHEQRAKHALSSVTARELKSAYRRQALQTHPDVNKAVRVSWQKRRVTFSRGAAQPDAADRFLRVKHAFTTLSDPASRAAYDRTRRGAIVL